MTTLLQALGDILRPNLVDSGRIVLEERQKKDYAPITLYTLEGREQSIVLRPDGVAGALCPRPDCGRKMAANDRLFPLFRVDIPKIAKMCDYIIFCPHLSGEQEELFVLHCELKSNHVSGSRIQIENGKLLADYVLAMAAHNASIRKLPVVKHRGLVFSPKPHFRRGDLLHIPCPYESSDESMMDPPHVHYRSGMEYPLTHFCV